MFTFQNNLIIFFVILYFLFLFFLIYLDKRTYFITKFRIVFFTSIYNKVHNIKNRIALKKQEKALEFLVRQAELYNLYEIERKVMNTSVYKKDDKSV